MNRLLVGGPVAPGERVVAGRAESHHLLDVQRVARGRTVLVSDGAGWQAEAVLVGVEAGYAVLEVAAARLAPAVPERVVVVGVPKPAAVEEALVAGTEAGASRFVLVRAQRSPPGELREERVERVLRASLTQCGRAELPRVDRVDRLGPWLAGPATALPARRFVATPGTGDVATPGAGDAVRGSAGTGSGADWAGDGAGGAALAVGPEGGWTDEEQAVLVAAGFVPIGLGPYILRTPTAVAAGLGQLWAVSRG